MKKNLLALAAITLAALATPTVWADAKLAKDKNCMTCHAVDKKILGPAFKEVAAKYAGQKNVTARLAEKIIKGGGGVWGGFMPANEQVSPDEAKKLATWVLSQK